jgi:Smg protein
MKLTKASYQFLMRIKSWEFITPEIFELIISKLIFSESRFVSLQETKWTIRNTLANSLDVTQLAFLDLVLYHAEDGLLLH